MALVFLPAADIPRFVGEGNVDLGITGQDMVAEASTSSAYILPSGANTPAISEDDGGDAHQPQYNGSANGNEDATKRVVLADLITQVLPLGFGKCKLQVQVPEKDTSVRSVEDLVGRKIATSFDGLAGEFFGALDAKVNAASASTSAKKLKTKIEYVGGSVEAACALGVADGIVDLVGGSGFSSFPPSYSAFLTSRADSGFTTIGAYQSLARQCAQRACTPSTRS